MSDSRPSILHVWNTAGVASTLAKWTTRLYGLKTEVYMNEKFDRFGHTIYGKLLPPKSGFRKTIFREAEKFDIVHLHELDIFVRAFKRRSINKPIVMHYHGSDIRGRWQGKRKYWKNVDKVIVSTIDLLNGAPEGCQLLLTPVDTELFHPLPELTVAPPDSALSFSHGANELATKIADEHGLNLYISPRNIPFIDMPHFLRRFSWYIDVKRNSAGTLLCRRGNTGSLTGLEASACGLKVINSDREIREELPPQHRAENAVKMLHPIYMSLME